MKVGIVGNYLVQYNRYVTELCENRDKPELHCNGKCQLAQELKQASETPDSPAVPGAIAHEPVFFFEPDLPDPLISIRNTHPTPGYIESKLPGTAHAVPTPPPETVFA